MIQDSSPKITDRNVTSTLSLNEVTERDASLRKVSADERQPERMMMGEVCRVICHIVVFFLKGERRNVA